MKQPRILSPLLTLVVAVLTLPGCTQTRFAQPWFFLLLIPAFALIAHRIYRDPPAVLYSRGTLLDDAPKSLRLRLRHLPAALQLLGLVVLIAALARPQFRQFHDDSVDGIDIMIAFDMSGSMAAVDMNMTEIRAYQMRYNQNPPNRFDHAQTTLKRFVGSRSRDRIGMVVFAKEAYLQFPLTLDYNTIQGLLETLELASIDPAGTAIGNAIGLSLRGLMDSSAVSRTVILITDGKQQGGNISPIHAAELARDQDIRVYPILVGNGVDTLVPVNGLSRQPSRFRPENHPIDPDLLQEIADMTGGAFYRATQPEELDIGLNQILNDLETTRVRDVANVQAQELFMGYALLAFLLLALATVVDSLWVRRFP